MMLTITEIAAVAIPTIPNTLLLPFMICIIPKNDSKQSCHIIDACTNSTIDAIPSTREAIPKPLLFFGGWLYGLAPYCG